MKIAGIDLQSPVTGEVVIPRGDAAPISLKIAALPIGAQEVAGRLFPVPSVPRDYARKGNAVLRDKEGKPIYEEKPDDPSYRDAVARFTRLSGVYLAYEGLRNEGRLTWDTPLDLKKSDPAKFYEAISGEFERSGLAAGDIALIIKRVLELSNFDREKVEAAREAFLSGAKSAE